MKTHFLYNTLILLLVAINVHAQTAVKISPNAIGLSYSVSIGNLTGIASSGYYNVLIGNKTGKGLTQGDLNLYLGNQAGELSTTASQNVFIGHVAGYNTSIGVQNTFIGRSSGFDNTSGSGNTFIGTFSGGASGYLPTAGIPNVIGANNTMVGFRASTGASGLSNATAIGANAVAAISNSVVLGNNANVGIGTNAPTAKLEIVTGYAGTSGLKLSNLTSSTIPIASNGKVLTVDEKGNVVLAIDVATGTSTPPSPSGRIEASTSTTWSNASFGTGNIMNANAGGVIIGTGISSLPNGYKLYVSEGILAEKIVLAIKNTSNWADFVFEKNYPLRSLESVETFIKRYKHLPEIPSAKEMVKNGLDVSESQAKLLQKVEELTLYLIHINTQIKKQNERLLSLEKARQ